MNLVLPYATLRPTNVLGVVHALDLLATGRRKVLHYASTLSVAACVDPAPCQFEETSPLPEGRILGAYAATKIEAEHLLQRGQALGHDVRIYRFGLLTGDSRTGAFAATCQLATFIRGLRLLGCVPEGEHAALRFDLTPVDQAALRMVAQADMPSRGTPWHIANAQSVSLAELLLDVDVPWVQDGVRYLPNSREAFFQECLRLLQQHGRHYQVLGGGFEVQAQAATDVISSLFSKIWRVTSSLAL